MLNYYEILGVNNSATTSEVRRAYRILARRYHPDLNPGRTSEDKFKLIAEAYRVLGDPERRRKFDAELESDPAWRIGRVNAAYHQAGRTGRSARQRFYERKFDNFGKVAPQEEESASRTASPGKRPAPQPADSAAALAVRYWEGFVKFVKDKWPAVALETRKRPPLKEPDGSDMVRKVSLLEISISLRDAIQGIRKTVEIAEPEGSRKVSIRIPPGVRNGSVLRMRPVKGQNDEDLVFLVRIAQHPFMSIHARGLVVEVPITLKEAICGASITVPTMEEPVVLKIPPGSQSGTELRVKERGVAGSHGVRGDLFFRLSVKVPGCWQAVGIKEQAAELDKYYESGVRQGFPKNLLDAA